MENKENITQDNKNPLREFLLQKDDDTTYQIPLWKRIALFLISLFSLFVFPFIAVYFVLGVPEPTRADALNFICYAFMVAAMFSIIVVDIPKYIPKLVNYKNYIIGFLCGALIIFFDIVYINLVSLHPMYATGGNETDVRASIVAFPALSIIFLGILGPICEELAHRAGVYKSLSKVNKLLAYFVSALIFAFLHFRWNNPNMIAEWLNFPSYFVCGIILAYAYEHGSIVGSCTAHITNNLFSIIMSLTLTGVIHA